jgi:hypothetical protein
MRFAGQPPGREAIPGGAGVETAGGPSAGPVSQSGGILPQPDEGSWEEREEPHDALQNVKSAGDWLVDRLIAPTAAAQTPLLAKAAY